MEPEAAARVAIDRLLDAAGWAVQDYKAVNLHASRGVAVREFPLKASHGEADYLLFVDGKAVGVIEAKPEGFTLTGVERQATKYSEGFPDTLPAWHRPLPFLYQSTGVETRFTNELDPEPRSRQVFAFHQPATLAEWVGATSPLGTPPPTLRAGLRAMPPLNTVGLWSPQVRAIENLERSMAENRPRALIQMATGSGKTYTAANFIYRLVRYAGARRVLFLVDRSNLGRQTLKEFQGFTTPDDGRKFTELYNVQQLSSHNIDSVSRVCIATIQRVFSMLKGQELLPELDELSTADAAAALSGPQSVEYNPAIPIETFDVIVTDEAHRSIYNLWRQVLEYFDASLIGMTATPSKQTFGFFDQNLVMEYNHRQAVADGVNVDFDIYRIRTEITERGAKVDKGLYVDRRNRLTRQRRWEQLDDEFAYTGQQLDRDVVAEDQIRTVLRAFKDALFTDIFPGRTDIPKTLIFAKDDSHADDIVRIARTELGVRNEAVEKITYRSTGAKPEDLLQNFRNSFHPRIAVTVDMIATGTDIKPLEVVFFMRDVQSRNFFEQMKGRGVRVISPTDFQAVTRDAKEKTRFVIVDAVGVTEKTMSDSYTLDRKKSVPFEKLLEQVALGNREPDVLSSLASRLARLERQLTTQDRKQVEQAAKGVALHDIIAGIVDALEPDAALEGAQKATGLTEPPAQAVEKAEQQLLDKAALPLASNPTLRQVLADIRRSYEQTIDTVTKDTVLSAAYSTEATERAKTLVQSFEQFIKDNKDEITALQALYSRPYRRRLTYKDIEALANALSAPPRRWEPAVLWDAYQRLNASKVRGSGQRVMADIVSLVRFALGQESELVPLAERVKQRFGEWLARHEQAGQKFTQEQRQWLEAICDHIAGSVSIDLADFELAPFTQRGGLAKAHALFGERLQPLVDELNVELVA